MEKFIAMLPKLDADRCLACSLRSSVFQSVEKGEMSGEIAKTSRRAKRAAR